MAEKKSKLSISWKVRHPDHCMIPVIAEDKEQATVKAAAFWGVPWNKVVAECTVEKIRELLPHNCPRCGRYVYENDQEYCPACIDTLKHEEIEARKRRAEYYRRQALEQKKEREESA